MKKVKKPKTITAKRKKLNTSKMLKHLESYSTIAKNILPMTQYLNQTVSLLSHPQIKDHIDNEKKLRKIYSKLRALDSELDSVGDLVNKTKTKIAQHLLNKEL
jgi:hypothetical protein